MQPIRYMPLGDDTDEEIDLPLHKIVINLPNNTNTKAKLDKTQVLKCRNNFFIMILCLTILIVLGILLYSKSIKPKNQENGTLSTSSYPIRREFASSEWQIEFRDTLSQSQIKLYFINEDSIQDLIVSVLTFDQTKSLIYGIDGNTGNLLWTIHAKNEVLDFNCDEIDINLDRKFDCLASGKNHTLLAFNPLNGHLFWSLNHPYFLSNWRIFEALVVPFDFDGDNVSDLIVSHYNDDALSNERRNEPGRVVLISGKDGQVQGECYQIPFGKGIFHRPVLHRQKDGSFYVLMGSASSQHDSGALYLVSLDRLYFYMMSDFIRLYVDWETTWNKWFIVNENFKIAYEKDFLNVYTLYSSKSGGVVEPPLLIDVNNDGTNDVLMSATDGTLILFDGETFEKIWSTTSACYYSHSRPVGISLNGETFILISQTNTLTRKSFVKVIFGRNGSSVWQMTIDGVQNIYPIAHESQFYFSVSDFEANLSHRIRRHGNNEGDKTLDEDKDHHDCPKMDTNQFQIEFNCSESDQTLSLFHLRFDVLTKNVPQIITVTKPKVIYTNGTCVKLKPNQRNFAQVSLKDQKTMVQPIQQKDFLIRKFNLS